MDNSADDPRATLFTGKVSYLKQANTRPASCSVPFLPKEKKRPTTHEPLQRLGPAVWTEPITEEKRKQLIRWQCVYLSQHTALSSQRDAELKPICGYRNTWGWMWFWAWTHEYWMDFNLSLLLFRDCRPAESPQICSPAGFDLSGFGTFTSTDIHD